MGRWLAEKTTKPTESNKKLQTFSDPKKQPVPIVMDMASKCDGSTNITTLNVLTIENVVNLRPRKWKITHQSHGFQLCWIYKYIFFPKMSFY